MGDFIVLAVLGVVLFFAIRAIIRAQKNGSCCGCSSKGGSCSCGKCSGAKPKEQ